MHLAIKYFLLIISWSKSNRQAILAPREASMSAIEVGSTAIG
jgi:hypothetical protein